jgi:hypothetical protein
MLTQTSLARLERVDADGSAWIDGQAVRVLSTVALADLQRAAAGNLPVLLAGDPPIIVGVVQGRATAPGDRLVLEAARELVLRCGASAIRIAADGTIRLEGRDIRSQARRLQRITGAQVRIN